MQDNTGEGEDCLPVVPLIELYDSVVEFEELVNRSGGIGHR